ncbi:MAG: bifunctional DNA-formamidopyrimidine glycosylase/DNA-(apurinic or apyrimidinic site) lyase [Actinomycetaceae bacterium]|nr:bifunctional DNA-formamidopyrimidine glycosylase/DNA-(apurinic or apyrimidinic site) lyase [Actinomycetaceae bacterium]
MPELPEVETIRLGLEPYVVGRTIIDAKAYHPRVARKSPAGLDPLIGQEIYGLARRGKYMWFLLSDMALVAHLGMSGQFRIGLENHPHRRAALFLDDGTRIDFIDQRTFGHLLPDQLVDTTDGGPGGYGVNDAVIPQSVAHIGRDLLDPLFDVKKVARILKTKSTEIKRALLDQRVASGIGNIYADEALWQARTHGKRDTSRMSITKITEVYEAAQDVMHRAVDVGGTSFDELYVNVKGESGYFERSLNVYGKTGLPCPRCSRPIRRISFMGRSSHICSHCQRFRG